MAIADRTLGCLTVDYIGELRAKGRLMMHGLPDLLQTVMRVTGWAELPNLVVCNCQAGSK